MEVFEIVEELKNLTRMIIVRGTLTENQSECINHSLA